MSKAISLSNTSISSVVSSLERSGHDRRDRRDRTRRMRCDRTRWVTASNLHLMKIRCRFLFMEEHMTTDPNYNTAAPDPMRAPGEQNDTLESQQAQQNAVQSDATASQQQQDVAAQQQPDPIQQDVVNIVKIGDADLASIVSAITPVIAAEFERILPALQAQGAQTARDVQAGVVSVIENQHMSLLSRIEGLLHPAH